MKKLSMLIVIVVLTGCTTPRYTRTIARVYDAKGNLQQTIVTDGIEQDGAESKPLHEVLRNRIYE